MSIGEICRGETIFSCQQGGDQPSYQDEEYIEEIVLERDSMVISTCGVESEDNLKAYPVFGEVVHVHSVRLKYIYFFLIKKIYGKICFQENNFFG
jgi:hypothetical protein